MKKIHKSQYISFHACKDESKLDCTTVLNPKQIILKIKIYFNEQVYQKKKTRCKPSNSHSNSEPTYATSNFSITNRYNKIK